IGRVVGMNRILVIRGGAIGDFILTLPALKALRDAYAQAHIEILGYKHIAVLAENRFYAQAVRSIEYGPLSSFFAKNSKQPAELANYFASFDLIVSYLYDPDEIFAQNLLACGVQYLIRGPFFFSSRRRHTRWPRDWSSDVCSSDLSQRPRDQRSRSLWHTRHRAAGR